MFIAIATKLVGCGWGARRGGFDAKEAWQLGVCMISRGEVGLIIASVGVSSGIWGSQSPIFSALFLVILLTTLLTPMLVRRIFRDQIKRMVDGRSVRESGHSG